MRLCFFTEVGKNINHDKVVQLKRFVEGYHKYVSSLNIPSVPSNTEDQQHEDQGRRNRKGDFFSSAALVSPKIELVMEDKVLTCVATSEPQISAAADVKRRLAAIPLEAV